MAITGCQVKWGVHIHGTSIGGKRSNQLRVCLKQQANCIRPRITKLNVLQRCWNQKGRWAMTPTLQAGIEFKKNLRVRFGKYGGLKLEYLWVVKSKKAKSFIRG